MKEFNGVLIWIILASLSYSNTKDNGERERALCKQNSWQESQKQQSAK